MRGFPTSTANPAVWSSSIEAARAAKSERSIVTLPPPHIRSFPLSRTRSPTMTYGSPESGFAR